MGNIGKKAQFGLVYLFYFLFFQLLQYNVISCGQLIFNKPMNKDNQPDNQNKITNVGDSTGPPGWPHNNGERKILFAPYFIGIAAPDFQGVFSGRQVGKYDGIGSSQLNPFFLVSFQQVGNFAFGTREIIEWDKFKAE